MELTRDPHPVRAAEIERWADDLAAAFNVLPMDDAIFRLWARLMHRRSDALCEYATFAATHGHGARPDGGHAQRPRLPVFDVPTVDPFAG